MKSKRQIIKETAAFYNLGNRSMEEDGSCCVYIGQNGKRCAFSRCCEETEENLIFLSNNNDRSVDGLEEDFGGTVNLLKEEYRGHSVSFWKDVQILHDDHIYWDEAGLSAKGEEKKIELLNRYSED